MSDINFTLTREQQRKLDKVQLHLNIKENDLNDNGKDSNRNAFDICEQFNFVVQKEFDSHNAVNKNLRIEQVEDGFVLNGIISNPGNK